MSYNPSLRHTLQYFYTKTTVIKSGRCHNSSNGAIFLSIRNRIVPAQCMPIAGQEGCNYFLMTINAMMDLGGLQVDEVFKPPFLLPATQKEISLLLWMPMHINEHLRYYGHVSSNVPFTLFAPTKRANKYRIRATVQRSLLTQSAVNYPALFLLYVWYFSFFVCRSGRNEHVRLVTIRKESHWGSFETGGNFLKCIRLTKWNL